MSTNKRIRGEYNIETLPDPSGLHDSTRNPELHAVNIKTSKLTVDGDIEILGDTLVKDFIEVSILDAVITLNSNHDEETGDELIYKIPNRLTPSGPQVGGIDINRGTVNEVQPDPDNYINPALRPDTIVRYNDTDSNKLGDDTDKGFWEATDNGIDYYLLDTPIILEKDTNPHLGGDLVVNGWKIVGLEDLPTSEPGDIILEADGDLVLQSNTNDVNGGEIIVNNPLNIKYSLTDPPPIVNYNKVYAKAPSGGGTGLYVSNDTVNDELVSRSKAIVFGLIF